MEEKAVRISPRGAATIGVVGIVIGLLMYGLLFSQPNTPEPEVSVYSITVEHQGGDWRKMTIGDEVYIRKGWESRYGYKIEWYDSNGNTLWWWTEWSLDNTHDEAMEDLRAKRIRNAIGSE